MNIKNKTELELGFSLKQNYSNLIFRTKENNKKLKNRPGLIAAITAFITILVCVDGELSHIERSQFFLFGMGIAIFLYVYFLYKHKSEIASNLAAIKRWEIECELQDAYILCLYDLEQEFERVSGTTLKDKVLNLSKFQKLSTDEKK